MKHPKELIEHHHASLVEVNKDFSYEEFKLCDENNNTLGYLRLYNFPSSTTKPWSVYNAKKERLYFEMNNSDFIKSELVLKDSLEIYNGVKNNQNNSVLEKHKTIFNFVKF